MQSGSLIRTPMVLLARNVPPSLWQSSMKIGLNKDSLKKSRLKPKKENYLI
jgi:hypothetical protein